ncbi:MAG: NUDIX hydrolase [Rubellimicrobium sp.]|nr:NUDIX hydrolase [Rubellimicrobium sp.]
MTAPRPHPPARLRPPPIRLAVRAIVLRQGRLLLVNTWPGRTDFWSVPGGGANPHESLPANLIREVHEETGLTVAVGAPCLVNEFHDPGGTFHQVDIYFRCTLIAGDPEGAWTDPEGVVSHRRWVTPEGMAGLRVKPDSLAAIAWSEGAIGYDPLEPIVRA